MCSAHLRQSLCCLWALLFGRITANGAAALSSSEAADRKGRCLFGGLGSLALTNGRNASVCSAWAGRNGNAYSHVLARCAEAVAIEFVSRQHERFGRGCTMLRVRVCKASTTVCGRCETHGRSRRAPPRERLCLHIQRCPSISAPACDQQSRPHSAPEPHVTRLVYNLTKTDRAHPLMQSRSGIQREGSCQLWHTA